MGIKMLTFLLAVICISTVAADGSVPSEEATMCTWETSTCKMHAKGKWSFSRGILQHGLFGHGATADSTGDGKFAACTSCVDGSYIISPEEKPYGGARCFSMYYSMYGDKIGEVAVYKKEINGLEVKLWSIKGNQGPEWKYIAFDIKSTSNFRFHIKLNGFGKPSVFGADNILVQNHECSAYANTSCLSTSCHQKATCMDAINGPICRCKPGYAGDGKTCKDVDECAKKQPCAYHAECTNLPGSFKCKCKKGFTGDGFICTGSDKRTTCSTKTKYGVVKKDITFKPLGCGNQYLKPLSSMVMLANFRYTMLWRRSISTSWNWARSKCACARLAEDRGFSHFSLRFWGECVGLNLFSIENDLKTSLKSDKCFSTRTYAPCKDETVSKGLCVGGAGADYVFKIGSGGVSGGPPGFG